LIYNAHGTLKSRIGGKSEIIADAKILALFTILGLFILAMTPIHEWCHVVAIRIVGGDAIVQYGGSFIPFGGTTIPFDPRDLDRWVYFAGGFGVFLGCMLLWFWSQKSRAIYISLPAMIIGLSQLAYAFVEAFIYIPLYHMYHIYHNPVFYYLFYYLYLVTYAIGTLGGLAIERKRLKAWFRAKEF